LTQQGEIAVLRRKGRSFDLDRIVRIGGHPTGMVLTHDGRTLIAANADAVDLLDVRILETGQGEPVRARLGAGQLQSAIYVNVTADDRTLLVSDERGAAVLVFNLNDSSYLGDIPVGRAPIAVTLSPDGRWLYTTSELAPPALHWPNTCAAQAAAGRRGGDAGRRHPSGRHGQSGKRPAACGHQHGGRWLQPGAPRSLARWIHCLRH